MRRKPSKMEGRKWEELERQCLVNVFGRVGMESLLLYVPLVCKSWYKATLSSQCWQSLVFPELSPGQVEESFLITPFMNSVVIRSCRTATVVVLPSYCTEEALLCVAEECPDLRTLVLPYDLPHDLMSKIPNLMSNWKNLEHLRLGSSFKMQEVLSQISIHCKNFHTLAVTKAYIGEDEASAIVTLLPNIRYLDLKYAFIEKENLVLKIMQGCKELVHFGVRRGCRGLKVDDEILKLGSSISTFKKHEGSKLFDYYNEDYLVSACVIM